MSMVNRASQIPVNSKLNIFGDVSHTVASVTIMRCTLDHLYGNMVKFSKNLMWPYYAEKENQSVLSRVMAKNVL